MALDYDSGLQILTGMGDRRNTGQGQGTSKSGKNRQDPGMFAATAVWSCGVGTKIAQRNQIGISLFESSSCTRKAGKRHGVGILKALWPEPMEGLFVVRKPKLTL